MKATYASNCSAPTPLTGIAAACDGGASCTYTFTYHTDPGFDPAPGCPKDLLVDYECVVGGEKVSSEGAYVPPEATQVELACEC